MSHLPLTLCIVMLLAGGDIVFAQSSARPSNVGTEFFLSFPSNWDEIMQGAPNPQKYIRLYITSSVSTEVRSK